MSIELFCAVLVGDRDRVMQLLASGTKPDGRLTAFWSGAIDMAAEFPQGVPTFFRRYRDTSNTSEAPNSLVIWTWTPLLLACAQSRWEIAGDLLDAGATAQYTDERDRTPLHFAVRGAQTELVRRLLPLGADPNATIKGGVTALMMAASSEGESDLTTFHQFPRPEFAEEEQEAAYLGIVQALLEAGADVNATAEQGDTALTRACSDGWTETVRLLLDAGASLECESYVYGSPLMACLPHSPETARLLLERGAAVDRADRNGETALSASVGFRRGAFREFVARFSKADLTLPSLPKDQPPISRDEGEEDLTALTMLLDAGADPNHGVATAARTPLIAAVRANAVDSIRYLVARGADVNGRNAKGRTPLMMAAWEGRPRVVQALLECGADYTLRTPDGITALMAATLPGNPERMLKWLETMPPPTLSPAVEANIQKLEALKEKLAVHGGSMPDPAQIRSVSTELRAKMRDALEKDRAAQDHNREKVIKILRGAGATE